MRDLELFEALRNRDFARAGVAESLRALETLALVDRAPYLGALEGALECPEPAVRAAALQALHRANGRLTFAIILRALRDPDEAVRSAAMEAFATCASRQPARFVHVLFHPDHAVRRLALNALPERQRALGLHLLLDPENAEIVRSWFAADGLPELPVDSVWLLTGLFRRGVIDATLAAQWLVSVRSGGLLTLAEQGRYRDEAAIDGALEHFSGAPLRAGDDVLDDLWAIVLGAPIPLRGKLLRLAVEHLVANGKLDRRRVAAALLAAEHPLSVDGLAVLSACVPHVLAAPVYPLALRRSAALRLLDLDVGRNPVERVVVERAMRELALAPPDAKDATVDLALVAALTRFAQPGDAYTVLHEVIGEERLAAAFLADPIRGAPLLSSRCLLDQERRSLFAGLRKRARERVAEIAAVGIWVLPADQFAWSDFIRGEDAVAVCSALFELERRPRVSFSDRKVRRTVDELGALLLRDATPLELAEHAAALARGWLTRDPDGSSAFGPKLFGRVARELSADAFTDLCLSLAPELLVRLIATLPSCFEIQFGKEVALAHALLRSGREETRAWATERAETPETRPERAVAPSRDDPSISTELREALATAENEELSRVLAPLCEVPALGLCDALELRAAPPLPSVAVCVALLGAHDEPDRVARAIAAHAKDTTDFLDELERAAVKAWAHTDGMPLLGAAWLWRWDRQSLRVAELAAGRPGGFLGLLTWALGLPLAPLREGVWSAVANALALFAARDKARFWAVIGDGRAFVDAAIEQLDTELGYPAASILLALHGMSAPAVAPALPRVREKLPDTSSRIAAELARLLNTQGLVFRREAARQHDRSASTTDLAAIRASTDLDHLEEACASKSGPLVQESVLRLLEFTAGADRLARVLRRDSPVPHAGSIADSVALWPQSSALADVRALLASGALAAELQFRLAVAFAERGELDGLTAAYAAACAPFVESWFKAKDFQKLCELDAPGTVACALSRSAHPHAYRAAVALLLEDDAVPAEARDAPLVAFLAQGSERAADLRLRVAERLLQLGNDYGFPLLFSKALSEGEDGLLRSVADGRLLELATEGVLMCGAALNEELTLVELLAHAPIEVRDRALERILLESSDERAAQTAIAELDQRKARDGKLRAVAELFAWGFRVGLMLTGRHHRPHMTYDGAYGYVRRNDPRVYVTPLPLLRGDPNGAEVVEGLILHELGHHRWHAGPAADEIWAAAEKTRMHGLLNLVADEHLERNLRAMHAPWGDKLKRLAAYAFQHAGREIVVERLLRALGTMAFVALTECELQLTHAPRAVAVSSGALLHALEAHGHPFARFMRALRMGLGNRHDDPLVEEALALFRGGFRKLEMPELLEIAKKLRALFADDIAILDGFGGAESIDEGERENTKATGTLTDHMVQPEVERILDPRKLKGGKNAGRGGGNGKLAINVSGVPHFDTIETVERLTVDPVAQREVERDVARPAAKLRRFFEELGLQREPVTRRTSGTRLDRARLGGLVLYRDPRVLVARQPHFDTNLFVGVLVDCSGSMEAADNIIKARRFAVLVAQAAKGLAGIDLRVFGFTDRVIYDAGDARRSAAASLEAGGGNNDAAALLHVASVAKESRRRAKVIVVVSDGLPTECSTAALKGLVERLENREHMVVAQVAVRPIEEQCFTHFVRLDEGELGHVVQKFGQVLASLVRKALR